MRVLLLLLVTLFFAPEALGCDEYIRDPYTGQLYHKVHEPRAVYAETVCYSRRGLVVPCPVPVTANTYSVVRAHQHTTSQHPARPRANRSTFAVAADTGNLSFAVAGELPNKRRAVRRR